MIRPGRLWALLMLGAVCWNAAAGEASLAWSRHMLDEAAFPENDETRRLLSDALRAPAYPAVESLFKIYRQLADDRVVRFEVRKTVRDWYLIFRNQRGRAPRETYPVWGRGTWVIKKDLLTGQFIQAKIFLQDDETSFVRLFPASGGRSRMDLHLYGRRLGDDVLIPVAFEELLHSPFARIVSLTRYSVDWPQIFPSPDHRGYRAVENFIRRLQPYSGEILELADGGVDGAGRNAYIETGRIVMKGDSLADGGLLPAGFAGLNCSGFVKWIVDGVSSAWSGAPGERFLDVPPLKVPTSRSHSNPWSESRSASAPDARDGLEQLLRDPRFGLDWNRNLARAAEEARLNMTVEDASSLDTGELAGIPFRQDMGYALDDLDSALYQLASRRPGAVYLIAVNSRFTPPPSPADPRPLSLHQYWHVSIAAPWFENGDNGERGSFRVAILDTGDVGETLLQIPGSERSPVYPAAIMTRALRYADLGRDPDGEPLIPDIQVHLSRIDIPMDFMPSPLPTAY